MTAAAGDQIRDKALYAYRLLAEETSDIVLVREPEGAVYFASPSLEKILGLKADDVAYTNYLAHVHPDDTNRAYTLNAVPLPGQTLTQTMRVRHADGHYIWLETTVRGVYDPATSQLRNVLSVSRDVTERIEHELEMKSAQESAESASKAKSRFLANMSH